MSPLPQSQSHQAYREEQASRQGMIYIGGNDGMLHGFNADNGEEWFAYVPATLFDSGSSDGGLHKLTRGNYRHRYYVDATPTVSDAYLNNRWRTILVGGLRGGGRGLYALDISYPESLRDETNAADAVLWEFTHPDLGHTYSEPVIAPIGDETGIEWYVITGNGYNDQSGGYHDGEAQLFLIKLAGPGADGNWDEGSDYYIVATGAGDASERNGLGSPQVTDYTGDYIADRVYAGDLFGNLWAINLPSSLASASARRLFTTVDNQPITARPVVAYNPNVPYNADSKPNLLVMFGSGQYLVNGDRSTTSTQYYYGIWDNFGDFSDISEVLLSQLVEQGPITSVTSAGSSGYRVMPDPQSVRYADPDSPKRGWYLPLPDSGERVVNAGLVLGDVIYFTTLVPSSDPCGVGGSGWLMGLDLATGARSLESIFDINNDQYINQDDTVSVGGSSVAVSGQQLSGGISSAPLVMGSSLYTQNSSGTVQGRAAGDGSNGEENKLKRQSWRQLYYDTLK
ncbi:MAG: hypothetical protein HUJ29_04365 [Gammaproteobacteria bacterium]|nr:hypothetical protein [Gammaproteobacteria bacterium]